MSIFSRFFSSRHTRVTVDQLGLVLASCARQCAFDLENSAHVIVRESQAPPQSGNFLYQLELILFMSATLDLIAERDLGGYASGVRRAMRNAILEIARGALEQDKQQLSLEQIQELAALIDTRLEEYEDFWAGGLTPISLNALSSCALVNISGIQSPDMLTSAKLSRLFGVVHEKMTGSIAEYEIVT